MYTSPTRHQDNEMNMACKELEEEIIEFLNEMSTKPGGKRIKPGCNLIHGKACALGTCVDNEPRVTPVDFFNEGMTLWIAGEPGGKIANIKRNPKVSIGIYVQVDHNIEQKSLQAWGKAKVITLKNDPEEFKKRIKSFDIDEVISGVIEELAQMGGISEGREEAVLGKSFKRLNFIKIVLEKVIILHLIPDRPILKKTWDNGKVTVKEVVPYVTADLKFNNRL